MSDFGNWGGQFGITPFEEEDMTKRAEYGAVADLGDPRGHLGLARQTVEEHDPIRFMSPDLKKYNEVMNDALLAHNNGDRIAAARHATRAHAFLVAANVDFRKNYKNPLEVLALDNMADRHLHHINNYINDLTAKKSGVCRNCHTLRNTRGECKC